MNKNFPVEIRGGVFCQWSSVLWLRDASVHYPEAIFYSVFHVAAVQTAPFFATNPPPTRHICWTQLWNRNILTGAKHRVHRVQVNSHTSRLIKDFTFCSQRHWNIGRVFPSWRMHFVAIIDLMPTLISQQCIFPPLVPPLFRSCIMQIAYFVVTLHLFFIFITKLEGLNFTLRSWSHITFNHV